MRIPQAALVLGVLTAIACNNPVGTPDTAGTAIRVSAVTTGPDADGSYLVAIDGGAPASLSANSSRVIDSVNPGSHELVLTGIAANCGLSGPNPRTVTAAFDITTDVVFSVACLALGSLRVTAATTGSNLPATYTVGVDPGYYDYQHVAVVPSNGAILMSLVAGSHRANLIVPLNCVVTSPNNVLVDVRRSVTTHLAFAVHCS